MLLRQSSAAFVNVTISLSIIFKPDRVDAGYTVLHTLQTPHLEFGVMSAAVFATRYGAVMLMKPDVAAGHISIELSEHVLNNIFFMVCLSPIMQVACRQHARHVPVSLICRVTLWQWQNERSVALKL